MSPLHRWTCLIATVVCSSLYFSRWATVHAQTTLYQVDEFHVNLTAAGDVDADGFDDFMGGRETWPEELVGYVRVFSGADGSPIHTFGNGTWYFGRSLSRAGDVNGDGFGDVVITGMDYADVYSGADGALLHHWVVGHGYTLAVAGGGDVDADGFDDVVVGARSCCAINCGPGEAFVFSGLTGEVLFAFDGVFGYGGPGGGCSFGSSVDIAGDVDADGHADIIVGAPEDHWDLEGDVPPGGYLGTVRVYSGADGSLLYAFTGKKGYDWFGDDVAGAGDVNQDGHADFAAGTFKPSFGVANNPDGFVRVFSGLDGSVLHDFDDLPDYSMHVKVGSAGDYDQDGFDDLIIGSPKENIAGSAIINVGAVRVFSGRNGSLLQYFPGGLGLQYGVGLGVCNLGDLNRDDYPDIAFVSYAVGFICTAPHPDLGGAVAGGNGTPELVALGALVPGSPASISLEHALPGQLVTLVLGTADASLPFKGGVLVTLPVMVVTFPVDGQGGLHVHERWPAQMPPGLKFYVQAWQPDAAAVAGFNASNGVLLDPP